MVIAATPQKNETLLRRAGIGLRHPHYREMLERRPSLGFLEVHSENYFGAGGPPHFFLEKLCEDYPLSIHGVGLSLGSTDPMDWSHLKKLKSLIDRYQPILVSEHLSWGSNSGIHTNDLLPMPYTEEAVVHMATRISEVQDFLQRPILVENLSSYIRYPHSTLPEWTFVRLVAEEADCGLLLDINNVYVNACNHAFNPQEYLANMPFDRVGEIHLAGFDQGENCLVDTHGKPVSEAVWGLYAETIQHHGPRPTLIEWDTDIPALDTLLDEAEKASLILEACHEPVAIPA
ncbi:MAG TPA: DUF692 domain-containing protein [Gammaproteobacteria bacterium]|nr:DUF692 domain-containing protein [Gammaproteobacteria bacterium]